jgi:thiamine-monophosphate kinase
MNEFDLINKYLKPIADDLTDDAAILAVAADEEIILSTDTFVGGVHFTQQATPAQIAHRCLRASLSDLAAMGARPLGYLLNLSFPKGVTDDWLRAFSSALKADQAIYGIHLWGGDTTRAPNNLVISVTVIGECQQGKAWKRSTAAAGDLIYVTGTIGDAYLGLKVSQGQLRELSREHRSYLLHRYYEPQPRFDIQRANGITAAIDISDGLLQDLGHVCTASHKVAHIQQDLIPLSLAARAALAMEKVELLELLTGGDDYELLLAVKLQGSDLSGLTQIGHFTNESATVQSPQERVHLVDSAGRRILFTKTGYAHEI